MGRLSEHDKSLLLQPLAPGSSYIAGIILALARVQQGCHVGRQAIRPARWQPWPYALACRRLVGAPAPRIRSAALDRAGGGRLAVAASDDRAAPWNGGWTAGIGSSPGDPAALRWACRRTLPAGQPVAQPRCAAAPDLLGPRSSARFFSPRRTGLRCSANVLTACSWIVLTPLAIRLRPGLSPCCA